MKYTEKQMNARQISKYILEEYFKDLRNEKKNGNWIGECCAFDSILAYASALKVTETITDTEHDEITDRAMSI